MCALGTARPARHPLAELDVIGVAGALGPARSGTSTLDIMVGGGVAIPAEQDDRASS
jgi:hypothetical protein